MAGRCLRSGATLIVLATLLATAGSMRAQAQGADDLAGLRDQASRLHSQGKYAEAIPLAERYVALASQNHGEEPRSLPLPMPGWLPSTATKAATPRPSRSSRGKGDSRSDRASVSDDGNGTVGPIEGPDDCSAKNRRVLRGNRLSHLHPS
jgi:hypothetical protein